MGDVNRSAIPPATGSYCDMIPTSRGGKTFFRIPPPFSRRAKPISSKFYRLPAAENRFSEIFFHFPRREGVFLRIYPISRRGKAFLESFDRFPAAGRRF